MNTRKGRCSGLFDSAVLCLAMLVGMLWVSGAAQAQAEHAARVHFASGYVAATTPGEAARELAKGSDIFSRDRVDTADNGRVQMRFTDGGLVSLMPNSTFTVDEYLHEGVADDDASLVFGLLKGGLRTVTGAIGSVQHDQYELKTPVATLGIRGTEYVAVLRPANTLRVHVGRGKVVITNEQGSLEVPEGRNAIVTLGSAPEFSEQGPQYQATGPTGDRLVATYQHRQDPHLLDPRANMPGLGEQSFASLPVGQGTGGSGGTGGTGGGTSPGGPPPLPPGGYQMAGMSSSGPFGSLSFYLAGINLDFDNVGQPSSLDPSSFDTGDWKFFDVATSGAVSWGAYTDGTGTLGGTSFTLSDEQFLPYVIGSAPTNVPQTGILSYALAGPSTAFLANSDGTVTDQGQLTKFNMDVNVGSLDFRLDMALNVGSDNYFTVDPASWTSGTLSGNEFSFRSGVDGGGCLGDCHMDVDGFFAGSNASQAGVLYHFQEGSDRNIYGSAGLSQ